MTIWYAAISIRDGEGRENAAGERASGPAPPGLHAMTASTPHILYAAATSLGGVGLAEVAGRAVGAIHAAGLLGRAVVYRNRMPEIPRELVRTVGFQPAKLLSWLPARYYYSLRRNALDRVAAAELRRRGASLVHGWTHECLLTLTAAKDRGIPAVLERNYCHPFQSLAILSEEYASRGLTFPPPAPSWLRRWDHWNRERTRALAECAAADYILLPSRFAYESFRERGYPPGKLVLLPRGVDAARFQPQPPADEVFRVLFVGQLCFRKGVPYLLEAWRRLNLPHAELVLAGSVHEEIKPLLAASGDLHNVKIPGFVADPATLFTASTVFCFPSLDEGAAKVTYEALAAGLPLITTPQAGSPVRDGVEGLLIPPRQTEALAAALERLYSRPEERAAMAAAARERVAAFTWEDYSRRLIAFYRGVWAAGDTGAPLAFDPGVDL